MKRLFRFRYPKLTALVVFSVLSYFIFSNQFIQNWINSLNELSYLGFFVAGFLFSFGFSTPFSIGFFLTANPSNIFVASVIGGIGAVLSDILLFKIIRFSFMDEFLRLEKTKPMKEISQEFHKKSLVKFRVYFMYAFAGFIIASPLPDEIGVPMLAGLSKIKTLAFSMLSFILKVIAIFIILYLGIVV